MKNILTFGSNELVFICEEDEPLCGGELTFIPSYFETSNIYGMLGYLFHYTQQLEGSVYINGRHVVPLSLMQTCGESAAPCDYVGIIRNNKVVPDIIELKNLIKYPIRLTGFRYIE